VTEIETNDDFRLRNQTSPDNTNMLKNLLCKIYNEGKSKLRFIRYDIQSLSKQGTMKKIILQEKMCLQNFAIVSKININKNDKVKVKELFEYLFCFSEF